MEEDCRQAQDGHKANKYAPCSWPKSGPFGDITLFSDDPREVQVLSIGVQLAGFPRWLRGKESASQCRRCRRFEFLPWVEKILWRRNGNPL